MFNVIYSLHNSHLVIKYNMWDAVENSRKGHKQSYGQNYCHLDLRFFFGRNNCKDNKVILEMKQFQPVSDNNTGLVNVARAIRGFWEKTDNAT